jgi:hypothetical protein
MEKEDVFKILASISIFAFLFSPQSSDFWMLF